MHLQAVASAFLIALLCQQGQGGLLDLGVGGVSNMVKDRLGKGNVGQGDLLALGLPDLKNNGALNELQNLLVALLGDKAGEITKILNCIQSTTGAQSLNEQITLLESTIQDTIAKKEMVQQQKKVLLCIETITGAKSLEELNQLLSTVQVLKQNKPLLDAALPKIVGEVKNTVAGKGKNVLW